MACIQLLLVFFSKNLLYLRCNKLSVSLITLGCAGLLCAFLHWTQNASNDIEVQQFETKDYLTLKQVYFPANDFDFIHYAPNTENVDFVMELFRQELEIPSERMFVYNNSADLYLAMEHCGRGSCFAINFQNVPDRGSNEHFKYSLSSNQMRLSPKKRYVNDDEINHQKDDDEYLRAGFLTLQYILDKQYLKYQDMNANYELLINSLPNLETSNDDSTRTIYFGTLLSILFKVLLLSTFIVPLVEEKQNGLKEFLNLVTPMSFLNGVTFFLLRVLFYAIFLIIVLIAAWNYKALGLVPFFYMFVLCMLFVLAAMSYAYLISACFHSVFYAKIGGLVMLVIPFVFNFVRSGFTSIAFFIFCTNTYLEGLDIFQTFSNKHREFGSADLTHQIKDNSSRILTVYFVLISQSIFYALLYSYLACVFPGPGGLKRSFLFFLNPETYKKRQRNEYTTSPRGTSAIIISDLCKKFHTNRRDTIIANNLNMTIKNKEITVLLGHNGAGKTTTMNMIMGLVPKDSGKIVVCSERDVASYRHLIGFCPQHSVFMSYMTCKEHLEFFAQLRGCSRKEARTWTKGMLNKLNLYEKCDEYGLNLSGGMRRRLSLGIALAGDTKIVILDEPSSGLDIESRRELWDILLNLRKEKAILITTHYMEEAETLGDTICILRKGNLILTGAPLELKRKKGSGYRLKLLEKEDNFNLDNTMALIRQYIPNASVLKVVKPTTYICLPYEYKGQFHDMLMKLEGNIEPLGIESISMSDTSLEDVFLNCEDDTDQVDACRAGTHRSKDTLITPYRLLNERREPSIIQQFIAIYYKKMIFLRHEYLYTCIMLLLPIICAIGAIIVMHNKSVVINEDALPLQLSQMRQGTIYIYNPTGRHSHIEQLLRQEIESNKINVETLILRGDNSVREELLALQRDNLAVFLQQVIGVIDMHNVGTSSISITDGTPTFNVYYATNRYHSSVTLVNLITTTMAKFQRTGVTIDTTYVPIRRFVTDISPTRLEYYAVLVPIALFFSMFYFVSLPFREHVNGFKQLQVMSHYTYWTATFTFDICLYMLMCYIFWLMQHLIMPTELYNNAELKTIALSVFFYGISYLPIIYCFANNFKSISTISTYLLLMLIISAVAPLITSNNMHAMKQHELKIAFLCFLPDFNLNHQLRIINENLIVRHRGDKTLLLATTTFYWYAVTIGALIMGFFLIVLENKYRREAFKKLLCQKKPKCVSQVEPTGDCQVEVQRVTTLLREISRTSEGKNRDSNSDGIGDVDVDGGATTPHEHALIVSQLRKEFNTKVAVDGLSFAANRGECFGLLGVNGAGKTTTFQMLTTNLTLTGGEIKIDDLDIRENELRYRYRFGYCPQYDALNKFMTAQESLRFMGRLRGLKASQTEYADLEHHVRYWLEQMDLVRHMNVQVRYYSGGTKRKLLAALAMIGGPLLVLLDEPTTGVDPKSRRFLWQRIKEFQREGRTVILSSHSMDECEELCNRLAIMGDGRFKCLNNICALKRTSGFTIKLKMEPDTETEKNVALLTAALKQEFSGLELRENHAGMLTYFVCNDQHILWSEIFKIVEYNLTERFNHLVVDYSVNECTLEDIFLKFDKGRSSTMKTTTTTMSRPPSSMQIETISNV